MTIEAVRQLPRSEKLKLMETLWEELSRFEDELESPAWHAQELTDTEQRLAEGKEQVLDWEDAKKSFAVNLNEDADTQLRLEGFSCRSPVLPDAGRTPRRVFL